MTKQMRAHTLENEFFHRVDQELIVKIQEQCQLEVDEDALAIATGIIDRKLLDELLEASITPKTLVAFSMFPAVYVAWSDGKVGEKERQAILDAAHRQGITRACPAHELLESWLKQEPTSDLFTAWTDFIHAVRSTISDDAFRELREAAMTRAQDVAEVAGGVLGILSVSESENSAVKELCAVFDDSIKAPPADG